MTQIIRLPAMLEDRNKCNFRYVEICLYIDETHHKGVHIKIHDTKYDTPLELSELQEIQAKYNWLLANYAKPRIAVVIDYAKFKHESLLVFESLLEEAICQAGGHDMDYIMK